MVQLTPEQEVGGHPLGPVRLVLSPHHLWLASMGQDGLLRLRETDPMVGMEIILVMCELCLLCVCQDAVSAPTGPVHRGAMSFIP